MLSCEKGHTMRSSGRPARLALLWILSLGLLCCGGVVTQFTPDPPPATQEALTQTDVQNVVQSAAASVSEALVIAVVDRAGRILAVYQNPGAPPTVIGDFGATVNPNDLAVSLARTAAFFSDDEAPLSSRTVRFISGIHFPPNVIGAPSGGLYGIENTNRGCPLNVNFAPGQAVPPSRSVDGTTVGLGITTGKPNMQDSYPQGTYPVNPGGVPIFKDGQEVGGVGVVGSTPAISEFAAYSGVAGPGFLPNLPPPGVVFIDGIALPFVLQTTIPAGASPGTASGTYIVGPVASPGPPPEGYIVEPAAGLVGGLSVSDVTNIVNNAISTANNTRGIIRLPPGQSARMIITVADLDGTILAIYRMQDSLFDALDVTVAKARNAIYFSGPGRAPTDLPGVPVGTAITSRAIGFGGQPLFPSGIDGTNPGPFFQLYQNDVMYPCTQGSQPSNPNQNGVIFFPGSVPLYLNGTLVGGLGVSGDGVDQDDYVAAGGATGYEAPTAIQSNQIVINNVRLPYLKFPRNPTLP
jgi:uncharacterized protein GlcG (DUF336 family)